jgi:DNA ligase D
MMRHPAYVQVAGRDVTVTNPDKVFFPKRGLTKGDLVNYYVSVAPALLPHVRQRVMQMLRYPNGVEGEFFYQKRVPVPHPEWLETYLIEFPSGRTADFPVVNDAAALAWIANLGCIDLHTWSSRIANVERPDYLLIDLDPRGGDPWAHVRTIALVVKDVMDELGLASWPKTSGSTGIHILAPIVPELPFPEVRRFAKAFAQEVERRVPDIATTTWKVADRTGVFVDFGQNARDRTIASAYSIRPTPDARASAPLRWDEVADVEAADFTMETMAARIAAVGDLMAGMWTSPASLVPLFERLKLKPAQVPG